MKILHTADWHIGKLLYKQSLGEEFDLFLNWLMQLIEKESIDVVLISGDIFDLANPSNVARKVYYSSLKDLSRLNVKVVITGGNHDSVHQLQASAEILSLLDIVIVGGLPVNLKDCIVPIEIGGEKVIIGAIPFIRDKDVRRGGDFNKDMDRIELVKSGIEKVYIDLKEEMTNIKGYELAPKIAMGHLFLQHSSTSESERDIQVGHLAGLESGVLSDLFDYVALGHIHRPQSFSGGKVQYSGSPIALSFSERKDNKQVVVIEINGKETMSKAVECPIFRRLLKIEGSFSEIQKEISNYKSDNPLPTYAEVVVTENEYSYTLLNDVRQYIQSLDLEDILILKEKVSFESKPDTLRAAMPEVEIQDVKPREVFFKRLDSESLTDTDRKAVEEGFDQLFQEVLNDL